MTSGCRDWPATQLRASFKGVAFEVDADARTGGRRIVTHEYPSREHWDNEDLGRLKQTVKVTGYVHGDDADARAERLFAVCASPNAGRLVLPTRPPLMARALTCSSTFMANAMGRMAVEMEFVVESGAVGGVFSLVLLANAVAAAATVAVSALEAVFNGKFNTLMRRFSAVRMVPAVARDAASATISLAGAALARAHRRVPMKDAAADALVDLAARTVIADAVAMAYQGRQASVYGDSSYVADAGSATAGFAAQWSAAMAALAAGASAPEPLVAALRDLMAFEPQALASDLDCLSVRAETALTAEVAMLVRRTALVHFARAMIDTALGSRADALAARAAVTAAFEAESGDIDDPDLAAAIDDVRNQATLYLSQAGADLPPVITVSSARNRPAAVLAAIVYDDATRDRELVERNRAPHPLFMPASIEALRP